MYHILSVRKMNYQKHIEKRGGCLYIRYTGELSVNDLPNGNNVFQEIDRFCRQNKCEKVFIDARRLSVDLTIREILQVGCNLSGIPDKDVKLAMLGSEEQVPPDNLMENITQNRGSKVRVFKAEDEAIVWLAEGRDL